MNNNSFERVIDFVRKQFTELDFIPLHAPVFNGNEKKYLIDTIDSTFVSSVGEYVNRFERMICDITGSSYAIAIVNGTSALHMALLLGDVKKEDEVISQSLTFIATCNAISYIGATPLFIDIDEESLGMSPNSLKLYLDENAEIRQDGFTYNKLSGKRIKACVPMHTFGLPCRIDEISEICAKWNISLIEDSAESLGSYFLGKHTGNFGQTGVFSFNGNKTVTCGGGGAIITNDQELARKAKHLTTQAKIAHPWEFAHDMIGYNYRMPNLNAALACAQLEQLEIFLKSKRALSESYKAFFQNHEFNFVKEPANAKSNYWLNAVILSDREERDAFLKYTNDRGVMTRPVWQMMHTLPMFAGAQRSNLCKSEWVADRLVNLPSSVRISSK